MRNTLSTPRDPRYADALATGYAAWDADRLAGHMVPVDRDGYARAFAQLATTLPERPLYAPRPRKLAPVRSALLPPEEMTDVMHEMTRERA